MKTGILLPVGMVLLLFVLACGCLSHSAGNAPPSGAPEQVSQFDTPSTSISGEEIQHNISSSGIPEGESQYIFHDALGNADRPITVFIYRPASWNTSGPILFVMHGADRNGNAARAVWIPYSDNYSSLIVAPEFSREYYPFDDDYNCGGMYFPGNMTAKHKADWTLMAIEHLFDDIRARSGATKETYLIFGHSAGAQFVHRLVMFLPDARFSRAVAANAGVYAMPNYTARFPFGLNGSSLTENDLKKVFSRNFSVLSGELDTDPNDSSLATFPAAEEQGSTRFLRALNYFRTARDEAGRLGVPLAWEYITVPGVGHDEAGMAGPSAEELFNRT